MSRYVKAPEVSNKALLAGGLGMLSALALGLCASKEEPKSSSEMIEQAANEGLKQPVVNTQFRSAACDIGGYSVENPGMVVVYSEEPNFYNHIKCSADKNQHSFSVDKGTLKHIPLGDVQMELMRRRP